MELQLAMNGRVSKWVAVVIGLVVAVLALAGASASYGAANARGIVRKIVEDNTRIRIVDDTAHERSRSAQRRRPPPHSSSNDGAAAMIIPVHVRRARFWRRFLYGGELGLCEAYMDGDWDTPHLEALVYELQTHEAAIQTGLRIIEN